MARAIQARSSLDEYADTQRLDHGRCESMGLSNDTVYGSCEKTLLVMNEVIGDHQEFRIAMVSLCYRIIQ